MGSGEDRRWVSRQEKLHQSAVKTEQLCQAWWRRKVSFVYAHNATPTLEGLQSWVTKPTNTEYTPLTWENLKTFKPYSIGQQLSQQSQRLIPFDETALQQQLPTITFINPLHLLVIHFWLAHRLLAPSFTPLCINLHAQHVHITKWTGWVGWITQASEGPTLGSWVTHPLSMLPNVSKSHHWNEHQTPCKPCTKQDTWIQTWYHLHLRATLFHNYTHNNSVG